VEDNKKAKSLTIEGAIILVLKNHPKKEISIEEIYRGVRNLIGKDIPLPSIRSTLYRRLENPKTIVEGRPQTVRLSKGIYRIKQ
jgi:hypothetical protein